MFLLDDILLSPGKAAYVLFQELAKKAREEWLNDEGVKHELQQLYEMLDSGGISEKDFEAQECRLLERLEEIARLKFQDKWGAQEEGNGTPPLQSGVAVVPLERGSDMSTIDVQPAWTPALALPPLPAAPPPVSAAPPVMAAMPPQPPAPPAAPPRSDVSPAPPVAMAPPFAAPTAVAIAPPVAMAPAAAMAPPLAAPSPVAPVQAFAGTLSVNHVMACALSALSVLKKNVSAITSVMPAEDGWRVTVELVERRGLPDTNDLLGIYELRLDPAGHVLRYERTQMRRRGDIGR